MSHDYQYGKYLKLGTLICAHIIVTCISLIYVSYDMAPTAFNPATYHVFFRLSGLPAAILAVAGFSLVAPLFVVARFSFGYLVGLNFFTMILGYLWLNCFTDLAYDHRAAGLSAAASALAFLIPAFLITTPTRPPYTVSEQALDRILLATIVFAAAVVAAGATYNFRMVSLREIYMFRDKLGLPTILNYLIGITSSSLLPFVFAVSTARKNFWAAGAALLLLLLVYPISLSKFALFAPLFLLGLFVLTKLFDTRIAAILSLLGPTILGMALITLFPENAERFFALINFRMMAIPSIAMDVYNDFFSRHELTHFCQITSLKHIFACPYQEPLAVMLERVYDLGNFNASLFATEGIASVGLTFAPASALICGLGVALVNHLSAGLPARFILLSGALMTQVMLNVPLSTTLVTHGAALLFLLWAVTPRSIFEQNSGR